MKRKETEQKANDFIESLKSDIAMRDKSLEIAHRVNEEIRRRNDFLVSRVNFLQGRSTRLMTRLLSAHMAIARLCGFIERVHEDDLNAGISEPTEPGSLRMEPRQAIETLLNMGDKQFERTLDAMGEDELADILGKPNDGPTDQQFVG